MSDTDPAKTRPNNLIFVSIASYRDQQLIPTIADCLAKARHPEQLRFGICWQHGPEESPLPYASDPRFQILDVDYRQSRGACWARAEIMKLWRGEAWFLQIDSHCRFGPGWDERLLHQAVLTGSAKPVLSTYASPFKPADANHREALGGVPQLMAISGFQADGIPYLKPVEIPRWQTRQTPMRARFLAAGYLFTLGTFVEEVGYDPDLYFFGEEIAMTLRAFTHGYDLFHPHQLLLWHDYVRSYATRHWDDHKTESESAWDKHDKTSRDKVASLLRGEALSEYGLGPARSLADYEDYAGVSFRLRKIQDDTRRLLEPPNPAPAANWADKIYPWLVRVLIDPKQLSPLAFEDPAFWYVTIHDEARNEIHRHDFSAAELDAFTGSVKPGNEEKIALVVELESGIIPVYWTVWPVSKSHGWLLKLQGKLADGDFAIVSPEENEEAEIPPS